MPTEDTKEKSHSSFGHRVKGAAHVVHGIGENIRGSVMAAAESVGGSEETKAKDEELVAKGRSEMERGIAQMKGVTVPGSTTAATTEPKVEGKTGDQPTKQEATQDPAPQGVVHTDKTQSLQAKPETSGQEPTGLTGTEDVQQSSEKTQAAPAT